jgi:cysteinyl-tRNA synthetase
VKNFASRTEEFKKQYPDDVARFESQLATMNKLLTYRESRYKQVQDELKNFSNAIDRAKALWDMSQSAQRMNRLAGMQTSDTFERIKTDAAIDSVTSSVNKAFSEMETSLMENPEVQQAQAAVGAAPSGVALPTPSVAKR